MPEWAARQLLHPEEKRGRERKEGERGGMEVGRAAGAGIRGLPESPARRPGPPCQPSPVPTSPGEGIIAVGRTQDWDTDKCALG